MPVNPFGSEVLHYFRNDDLEELKRFLEESGWRVYVLDGDDIVDKSSFFAKTNEQLPIDLGQYVRCVWDAWIDLLRYALLTSNDPLIAIVWTHTEQMQKRGSRTEFASALECFECIATDLTEREEEDDPLILRVFLLGEGERHKAFPAWRGENHI